MATGQPRAPGPRRLLADQWDDSNEDPEVDYDDAFECEWEEENETWMMDEYEEAVARGDEDPKRGWGTWRPREPERCDAALAFIHRLPTEVLSMILALTIDSGERFEQLQGVLSEAELATRQRLTLGAVCQGWHRLLLRNRELDLNRGRDEERKLRRFKRLLKARPAFGSAFVKLSWKVPAWNLSIDEDEDVQIRQQTREVASILSYLPNLVNLDITLSEVPYERKSPEDDEDYWSNGELEYSRTAKRAPAQPINVDRRLIAVLRALRHLSVLCLHIKPDEHASFNEEDQFPVATASTLQHFISSQLTSLTIDLQSFAMRRHYNKPRAPPSAPVPSNLVSLDFSDLSLCVEPHASDNRVPATPIAVSLLLGCQHSLRHLILPDLSDRYASDSHHGTQDWETLIAALHVVAPGLESLTANFYVEALVQDCDPEDMGDNYTKTWDPLACLTEMTHLENLDLALPGAAMTYLMNPLRGMTSLRQLKLSGDGPYATYFAGSDTEVAILDGPPSTSFAGSDTEVALLELIREVTPPSLIELDVRLNWIASRYPPDGGLWHTVREAAKARGLEATFRFVAMR